MVIDTNKASSSLPLGQVDGPDPEKSSSFPPPKRLASAPSRTYEYSGFVDRDHSSPATHSLTSPLPHIIYPFPEQSTAPAAVSTWFPQPGRAVYWSAALPTYLGPRADVPSLNTTPPLSWHLNITSLEVQSTRTPHQHVSLRPYHVPPCLPTFLEPKHTGEFPGLLPLASTQPMSSTPLRPPLCHPSGRMVPAWTLQRLCVFSYNHEHREWHRWTHLSELIKRCME